MSVKKIFFFDIDGTLLPHGNKYFISEKNRYALNKLEQKGHDVIVATGKSKAMIKKELAFLKINNHITINGAIITKDNKIVSKQVFTGDDLEEIKQLTKDSSGILGCQTNEKIYLLANNYDQDIAQNALNRVSIDLPEVHEDFIDQDQICQMWVLGDLKLIDNPILNKYNIFKWGDAEFDIAQKDLNKAIAINKYLSLYYANQTIETYAFGDGENDIEMLECVDHGIAMGNAIDELKLIANDITDSCIDDGVYNYLVKNKLIEEIK